MDIIKFLKEYEYEFTDINGTATKSDLLHLYNINPQFHTIINIISTKQDVETFIGIIAMLIENIEDLQRKLKNQMVYGNRITINNITDVVSQSTIKNTVNNSEINEYFANKLKENIDESD